MSLSQRYKHPKKQKQNQELQKIKQKNKPQKQKSNNMHSISKQLELWSIVFLKWVPISLTNKVSDGWIRDLRFNPRLHKKSIDDLVW